MADVKWIKIVTDIFDDEKILLIESMPDADSLIVIWFKLLCLAGKQNNSGVFMINDRIHYTDEMFATIFRRNLNTVRLALDTFERFGMIERIDGTVTIPNWGKHQTFDRIEAKNDYMRKYMREYRAKQKALSAGEPDDEACNANRKANSKDNVSEADKNKNKNIYIDQNDAILIGFDVFWKTYPRKVSKAAAIKVWSRLKPKDALVQAIIKDVERRKNTEWKDKDKQYIPYPATYLNQRRWEDEEDSGTVQPIKYQPTVEEIMQRAMSAPTGVKPW